MANQGLMTSMLVFRIFTLLSLIGSMALMVANHYTNSVGTKTTFKDIISYRYVLATAVIGAAYTLVQLLFAIYYACTEKRMFRKGCLPEFDFYGDKVPSSFTSRMLMLLLSSICYHIINKPFLKRRSELVHTIMLSITPALFTSLSMPVQLISLILATGVGAGFAVSFELKRSVHDFFDIIVVLGILLDEEDKSKFVKFLNRGIISTGLLALGLVCMVMVSVLSSINRSSSARRGFFQ